MGARPDVRVAGRGRALRNRRPLPRRNRCGPRRRPTTTTREHRPPGERTARRRRQCPAPRAACTSGCLDGLRGLHRSSTYLGPEPLTIGGGPAQAVGVQLRCFPVPTHRELPLGRNERLRRRRNEGRGLRRALPIVLVLGLLVAAVLERTEVVGRTHVAVEGASHNLPGAYIAVPGPWHSRWVPVKNQLPGLPRYVHERFRTIRYVPAP